jgi:hypothetical protein
MSVTEHLIAFSFTGFTLIIMNYRKENSFIFKFFAYDERCEKMVC